MKLVVKKHKETVLHVILRPNALILLLFGLLFIVVGFVAIQALVVRTEVWVERGELHYERHSLGIRSPDSFVLPASSVTDIEIVLKKNWFSRSYEVAVNTSQGASVLYFPNADGDKKREIAEQSFVALSSGGTYQHEDDGTIGGLMLGLTCILGGLWAWSFIQQVVVVADRKTGTLTIRRKRRLVGKGDGDEIPLDQITDIQVATHTLDTAKQQVTSYQVLIEQQGGKPVPIATGPMFTATSAEALKELLDTWLTKHKN